MLDKLKNIKFSNSKVETPGQRNKGKSNRRE